MSSLVVWSIKIVGFVIGVVLTWLLTAKVMFPWLVRGKYAPVKAKNLSRSLMLLLDLILLAAIFYDFLVAVATPIGTIFVLSTLGLFWLIYFIFALTRK